MADKLYPLLATAEADESLVGKFWVKTRNNMTGVLSLVLQGLDSPNQSVRTSCRNFVTTGRFILCAHAACSDEAFKRYGHGLPQVDVPHLLEAWGIQSDAEALNMTKGTVWGILGIIFLSYARSNNWTSLWRRIETAFKIAGMLIPTLLGDINRAVSANVTGDIVEKFHSALWAFPDFAKAQILGVLTLTASEPIGSSIIDQSKMVFSYSQMTFIVNIKTFMQSSTTSVRVLKFVVDEYRRLLQELDEVKALNPGIIEGHLKLLRATGSERLDSTKFPILVSVILMALEQQSSPTGTRFVTKVTTPHAATLRSAFAIPLPSRYSGTNTDSLSPEDLRLIGLAAPPTQ